MIELPPQPAHINEVSQIDPQDLVDFDAPLYDIGDGVCDPGEIFDTSGNKVLTCVPLDMVDFAGKVANANGTPLATNAADWYRIPNLSPGDSMYAVEFNDNANYDPNDDKISVQIPTESGTQTITLSRDQFTTLITAGAVPNADTSSTIEDQAAQPIVEQPVILATNTLEPTRTVNVGVAPPIERSATHTPIPKAPGSPANRTPDDQKADKITDVINQNLLAAQIASGVFLTVILGGIGYLGSRLIKDINTPDKDKGPRTITFNGNVYLEEDFHKWQKNAARERERQENFMGYGGRNIDETDDEFNARRAQEWGELEVRERIDEYNRELGRSGNPYSKLDRITGSEPKEFIFPKIYPNGSRGAASHTPNVVSEIFDRLIADGTNDLYNEIKKKQKAGKQGRSK